MSNNSKIKKKAIALVQEWGAGKISIGTEFKLMGTDRILKLVESEGYPYGKLIFNDGEEFNIGKYFNSFFLPNTLEKTEQEKSPVYNEEVWNELTKNIEQDKDSSIIKTFVSEQENKSYHNITIYDVTDIIEDFIKHPTMSSKEDFTKQFKNYLIYNNYPYFTKEKLYELFSNCEFHKTLQKNIVKVMKDNKNIGYLVAEKDKYIFVPKQHLLKDEYVYENDQSIGFFNTAENYLEIALSSIERYKKQFVPIYNTSPNKSKESYSYQADASIKTLLAFSCECYMKSLLINEGFDLANLKSHKLSVLFTSLSDDQIAKIFAFMERNGYNLENSMYNQNYKTNDLTEKFMLDLAMVDDAFVDSRYSAEDDKNTDYNFLYQFALALRHYSKKEYMTSSPFDESITSIIKNRK